MGISVHGIHNQQTVRKSHDRFYGICQAFFNSFLYDKAVHHNFYVMLDVFIQRDLFGKLIGVSVHQSPDVAALSGLFQDLGMGSLPPPHNGGKKLDSCPFRHSHDKVDDLVYRLPADLSAAFRAMGDAHPGKKEAEMIIDLRHRAHRRPGIPVCGFLVN